VKIAVVAVLLLSAGLSGIAFWQLRKANLLLGHQVAAARTNADEAIRLRTENERLERIVALAKQSEIEAQRSLHREAEQARSEVEALEKKAEERYGAKQVAQAAEEEALRTNRDLRKGPVLIENLTNAGQSSPVDAFQTLVWAAANGHDDIVANRISITGGARMVAEAMIATLPEATRNKYPTAESLTALYVADQINEASAIQVVSEKAVDAQHVTLSVGKLSGRPDDIPMQLGPDGWQIDLSNAKLFEKIKRQLLKPRK
jgi:hypothetical protein